MMVAALVAVPMFATQGAYGMPKPSQPPLPLGSLSAAAAHTTGHPFAAIPSRGASDVINSILHATAAAANAADAAWRHLRAAGTPKTQAALMTLLVLTPALNGLSRSTFNNLARFLAGVCGAPAWITAATQMSGAYVGRSLRWTTLWGLTNHALRMVPPETTLPIFPKLVRALLTRREIEEGARNVARAVAGAAAAAADGNVDIHSSSLMTAREVQSWWFRASTRALLAALCILAAQWIMQAKRPPPSSPAQQKAPSAASPTSSAAASSSASNEGPSSTAAAKTTSSSRDDEEAEPEHIDLVEAHFAALRGDEGVSWDRQARSVLIDSGLTLAVYAASVVAVANALQINISGVLAVGGFSGVAAGIYFLPVHVYLSLHSSIGTALLDTRILNS